MERVVKDGILALLPSKNPHTAKEITKGQRSLHILFPKLQSNSGGMGDLLTQMKDLLFPKASLRSRFSARFPGRSRRKGEARGDRKLAGEAWKWNHGGERGVGSSRGRGGMAHGSKRMVRRGTDPRRQFIHVSWWAANQRVGRTGWSRFSASRSWSRR
jgi:hypothetical protein